MRLYKSYLRSAGVEIGDGGMVSLFASIDVRRGRVVIGDDVTITAGCYILSHSAVRSTVRPDSDPPSTTILEDGAFVGVNSVVLPGVRIGENAIVGAGSVVTGDVEPNSVYAGNPAQKVTDL